MYSIVDALLSGISIISPKMKGTTGRPHEENAVINKTPCLGGSRAGEGVREGYLTHK
jgi:hypothetical protein